VTFTEEKATQKFGYFGGCQKPAQSKKMPKDWAKFGRSFSQSCHPD
jgi:hypothetical protein